MSPKPTLGDALGEHDRRTLLGMIGTASIGLLAGCGGSPDPAETVAVGPDGESAFEPETVEIVEEETVEFVWESDGHTLVWDSVPEIATELSEWEGVPETRDEGYTHTEEFLMEGTYEYSCDRHEGMEGTIEVVTE